MGSCLTDQTAELQNVAKRELVADVARQFGEVRLKVTGTSMLPAVWPGDILTVRRRAITDLLPGQIVLCYRNQGFIAHRLVIKRGDCIITRGDALSHEDCPFQNDEVLGEVISILRNGRPVAASQAWWHSAGSWILRHSELCTRMLLRLRRLARLSWAG